MEFKGTKGKLELKYVSGICIGIGTKGNYSQITANTILPDTDEDYEKEKEEIESNMLIYSKAPEMLDMLKRVVYEFSEYKRLAQGTSKCDVVLQSEKLIKEATELK